MRHKIKSVFLFSLDMCSAWPVHEVSRLSVPCGPAASLAISDTPRGPPCVFAPQTGEVPFISTADGPLEGNVGKRPTLRQPRTRPESGKTGCSHGPF